MNPPRIDNAGTPAGPQPKRVMPIDPNSKAVKEALKEGLQEWLNDQMAEFGKWSLRTLLALFVAGIVWLALVSSGWKHP